MVKRRTKRIEIIRPGVYTDAGGRQHTITKSRIEHWKQNFDAMKDDGLLIPAPYRHDESSPVRKKSDIQDQDGSNNAGFWETLWIAPEDNSLWGEVEPATDEDAKNLGTRVKGVSLLAPTEWIEGEKKWQDAITHIALTNKPVAKSRRDFEESTPGIALSLSSYTSDLPTLQDDDDEDDGATLDTALACLADLGMKLPDDTTDANIVERIAIAGLAIKNAPQPEETEPQKKESGGTTTKPPQGSRVQKPSPVAMSTHDEVKFALEVAGQDNPATEKPWTPAEIKAEIAKRSVPDPVALSAELDQWKAGARESVKAQVKSHFESAVSKRPELGKWAKETVEPLMNADNFDVRMSADGTFEPPLHVKQLMDAVDNLPPNPMVSRPTSYVDPTNGEQDTRFSFDFDEKKVPEGATVHDIPRDDSRHAHLEPKQIKDIASEQLADIG